MFWSTRPMVGLHWNATWHRGAVFGDGWRRSVASRHIHIEMSNWSTCNKSLWFWLSTEQHRVLIWPALCRHFSRVKFSEFTRTNFKVYRERKQVSTMCNACFDYYHCGTCNDQWFVKAKPTSDSVKNCPKCYRACPLIDSVKTAEDFSYIHIYILTP